MILLGIDPGIADMGYGVIEHAAGIDRCLAYGSIRTSPDMAAAARLKLLYEGLLSLIETHRPERMGIERLYFQKNVKTAMAVAEARGIIRLCAEHRGLPCNEFNPADVKIAVCGHGAASKLQVQRMVKTLLGLDDIPKPDDAADALAIAIALAHTKNFAEMKR